MNGILRKIKSLFRSQDNETPNREVLKKDLHQEAMAIVQKRMDKERARKAQLKLIRHKLENNIPLNDEECKRIKVLRIKDNPTSYQ